MGFFGCVPRFLKAHAGWVLTALGSAGLVGTAVLVAKEAPEAEEAISIASSEKISAWIDENHLDAMDLAKLDEFPEETELSFWEKTKIAFPIYIPAILTGAGTLACFWGAQIFNVKKQAALVAAYGTLAMQFDQYREAIKAEYGEEADKKALEITQREVRRLKAENARLAAENAPKKYMLASLPEVIFEAKPEFMSKTFMLLNRNLLVRGSMNLLEEYKAFGIPEECYDTCEAENYGWEPYENEVSWGSAYVDYCVDPIETKSGEEVYLVSTYISPFCLGLDYGFQDGSLNNILPGYNFQAAVEFIKSINYATPVKLDEPDLRPVYY